MTPQERQCIVWAAIERLAFRPRPAAKWLGLYEKTIHQLWEVQPGDVPTRRNAEIQVPFLNIACNYVLEDIEKYTASILLQGQQPRLLLAVHVDPSYASKGALHRETRVYERQDYARYLQNDVESVLDGMVFHPRNHTHLEDCGLIPDLRPNPPSLSLHEIRFGGGIENVFVFLFHLRYQFCLVSEEARVREKSRLVTLFVEAIRSRRQNIPPSDLFDFKEQRNGVGA